MPHKDGESMRKYQREYREKIRCILRNYLSDKKCVDCGEDRIEVLDFDHRDRKKKFKEVSKMRSGHYCWDTIKKEIDKCDVRCANCHRIKTLKENIRIRKRSI